MKSLFFSITLALACWSNMMMAEIHEHEYVPLLEDGRQWIYSFIEGTYDAENDNFITSSGFYKIYLQGDTVIDGKNHLKCYYRPLSSNVDASEDNPIAYLREEGKLVYAVDNENNGFYDEPIYGGPDDPIYNFEDMSNVYEDFQEVSDVFIAGKWRRVFKWDYSTKIIEGIGADGFGNLLYPVQQMTTCSHCDYKYDDGLAMMLDKEGNILYKGSAYVRYLESKIAGDVNGDGLVNVSDVTALINLILGVK